MKAAPLPDRAGHTPEDGETALLVVTVVAGPLGVRAMYSVRRRLEHVDLAPVDDLCRIVRDELVREDAPGDFVGHVQ